MKEAKLDVAGRTLAVGDKVAFCMAGRSGDMRVGEIIEMKPKTAVILYRTMVEKYIDQKWRHVEGDETCSRNYENICLVN
ncbi:hypothetical protein D3C78_998120 [compost metagenome]